MAVLRKGEVPDHNMLLQSPWVWKNTILVLDLDLCSIEVTVVVVAAAAAVVVVGVVVVVAAAAVLPLFPPSRSCWK